MIRDADTVRIEQRAAKGTSEKSEAVVSVLVDGDLLPANDHLQQLGGRGRRIRDGGFVVIKRHSLGDSRHAVDLAENLSAFEAGPRKEIGRVNFQKPVQRCKATETHLGAGVVIRRSEHVGTSSGRNLLVPFVEDSSLFSELSERDSLQGNLKVGLVFFQQGDRLLQSILLGATSIISIPEFDLARRHDQSPGAPCDIHFRETQCLAGNLLGSEFQAAAQQRRCIFTQFIAYADANRSGFRRIRRFDQYRHVPDAVARSQGPGENRPRRRDAQHGAIRQIESVGTGIGTEWRGAVPECDTRSVFAHAHGHGRLGCESQTPPGQRAAKAEVAQGPFFDRLARHDEGELPVFLREREGAGRCRLGLSKVRHEGTSQEAEGQRKKTEGFAERGGFHEME